MANLSNINNKFLVTTGGEVLVGRTAATGTSKLQVSGSLLIGTDINSGIPLVVQETTADGFAIGFMRNTNATNGNGLVIDVNSAGGAYIQDWRQASTVKMRLLQNGNLGIGTDSPNANLDILNGTTGASLKLSATSTAYWQLQRDSVTGNLNISDDALGNVMSFDQLTGNVGIGTTSPGEKLEVDGNAELKGNLIINKFSNTAPYADGEIRFTGRYDRYVGGIKTFTDNASYPEYSNGLDFFVQRHVYALPNGHLAMRIDSLGNVGIGTTSPTTALTIRKAISPTAYGEQASMIEFKSYYTGYDTETVKSAIYSGVSSQTTLQTTRGFMSFWTADYVSGGGQSLTEKMRIESNGNVGIGTSSPDTLLHVSNNSSNSQLTIERIGTAPGKYGFYTNTGNLFINNITGGASTIPMIILNNGNVGIGAGNPSSKLAIDGGFDYPTVRWFSSNNTSRYMQVGMITPTEHSIRAYGSSSELTFWTASSFSMVIDGGGNVGIGITNPQDKLHVSGDAIISSTRHGDFAVASISTTGYAIANVGASTNGQSAIVEFVASGNNGGYYNVVYSCYNGGGLWYYTKNVVGSGGNIEVAETNGSGSSTLVFYFRATSGSASYTPRVMMKGMPYNLVTF